MLLVSNNRARISHGGLGMGDVLIPVLPKCNAANTSKMQYQLPC